MKKANLAFTGIPTFCRTPHVASLDLIESQVAVLGIPFDEGVGYRPGTRFGPRSIREYSMRFPYFDKSSPERGYWDIEKKKRFLSNVDCVDCGDVDIVALGREYVYGQIDESIKKAIALGGKIVTPKSEVPNVGWIATALDPEGNHIALLQPQRM